MADEILTVRQKLTLSRELGFDWEILAGLLGFHRADIDGFKHDAGQYHLQTTIMLMLDRWCQQEAHNPASVHTVLIPALKELERTDLIEKMHSKTAIGIPVIKNVKKPVRYFQTRPDIEEEITKCVSEHKMALLSGIHGSGKSQMALHYWVKHHDKNQTSVNWLINATSEESLEQSLRELGRQLRVNDITPSDGYQSILSEILKHLHFNMADGSHFLIFDDITESCCYVVEECVVDEEADNVCVIMTSVFKDLPCSVSISGFREKEVVSFFHKDKYCKEHLKSEEIISLGKDTQHLPLAMAAARSYISKCKLSIAEYRRKLSSENEKVRKAIWDSNHLLRDYDKSMLAAFLLNVQELKSQLQGEYEPLFTAFQMMAFLGSEEFPLFLFMKSQLTNLDEDERDMMEYYFVETLGKLSMGTVSVFECEGSDDIIRLVSVHDAIRLALILSFDETERQTTFKKVSSVLVAYMCDKDNRFMKSFSLRSLLFSHLLALEKKWKDICSVDLELQLMNIHFLDILGYHYIQDLFRSEGGKYLQSAINCICKIVNIEYSTLFQQDCQSLFDKLTSDEMVSKIPLDYLNKFCIQRIYDDEYLQVWDEYLNSKDEQVDLMLLRRHSFSDVEKLEENGVFLKSKLFQKLYLVELMVSALYTYARTYFRGRQKSAAEKEKCYLHACLARDLGMKIKTAFGIDILHSVLVNRSAVLPFRYDKVDLKGQEKDPKVFEEDVKTALLEFQNLFEDDKVYYQLGVLKSIPSQNNFHYLFCYNKIFLCFKLLHQITKDDVKKEQVFHQGFVAMNRMMKMLNESERLGFQSESWYHVHAAEFLMLSDIKEHTAEAVQYLLSAVELNKKMLHTRQKHGNMVPWLKSLQLLVDIHNSSKQKSDLLEKSALISEIQLYIQAEKDEQNKHKASHLIEKLHE